MSEALISSNFRHLLYRQFWEILYGWMKLLYNQKLWPINTLKLLCEMRGLPQRFDNERAKKWFTLYKGWLFHLQFVFFSCPIILLLLPLYGGALLLLQSLSYLLVIHHIALLKVKRKYWWHQRLRGCVVEYINACIHLPKRMTILFWLHVPFT